MTRFPTYDPDTDFAARVLAGTLATVAAGPVVELDLLGSFTAADRSRLVYTVKVDGETIGSAVEWTGPCFVYSWGLTIPGHCIGFGFPSREALEIAVARFVAVGAVEG
jgi:hypothetical protein